MTNTVPITAVAVDGPIDPLAAAERLRWPILRRYSYGIALVGPEQRTIYLFRFGAVVLDRTDAIPESDRQAIETAVGGRLLPGSRDTYNIRVDPEPTASTRVGWDIVVVPELSTELMGSVALLLGQSAALERYETTATVLLEETLALVSDLGTVARFPRGTRRLVRRIARLTRDRLDLARWFYFVDRPEETWEDARVAGLYDSLFENLELAQRHTAMLHKLAAVETATQMVIDLWHGRRSRALEWAIVILIVVEIGLALAGLL